MTETLEGYKKRVYEVAKRAKEETNWCDTGFKSAMRELDILVLPDEPSPGSVVLHPSMSIAWVRTWAGGWRTTERVAYTTDDGADLTWEAIVDRCDAHGREPVVLLDTNGRRDYPDDIEGIML